MSTLSLRFDKKKQLNNAKTNHKNNEMVSFIIRNNNKHW